ncbi:hypothetical protein VFC49_04840 [Thermococcus sp. SY098]|uniref:hypothetical protein n=1 Tax=Thermococcus sp. SY098 TaxID=3111325 RepID=UPI002D775C91|nr:hypothetical protein [Thermococcus sp. SY098]WRS53431.1 hypothetical protein VFC49_04840 [Thermococcus sp. SY098]
MEEVFEEIEKRIKRLEAEIELAEQRLKLLEETGAAHKYRIWEKRKDYSEYYLILIALWLVVGMMFLYYIKSRYAQRIPLSLTPYVVLVVILISFPLGYLIWKSMHREAIESPLDYLHKREKSARIVLNEFYLPLKEALKKQDKERLRLLADTLLTNLSLAEAIENINEGNPKIMAYALYLYISRDKYPNLKDDIEEAVALLRNKPLKALMMSLLEKS